MSSDKETVQRWQSRGGRHWLELYRDPMGFFYSGDDCGANLGNVPEAAARARMVEMVESLRRDGINLASRPPDAVPGGR